MPAEAFVQQGGASGEAQLVLTRTKHDYSGLTPLDNALYHVGNRHRPYIISQSGFGCGVLKFSVVKGEFWELWRPICALPVSSVS